MAIITADRRHQVERLAVDEVERLEPERWATAGLAASDSTMPITIRAPMANSVTRSTLHHHSPNVVFSRLDTMAGLVDSSDSFR